MIPEYLRVIVAILAVYRMAQLFPDDDGPLFVFKRLRMYVDSKALADQKDDRIWSLWNNINDGIHCVYCAGFYAGIVSTALMVWPTIPGDLFLLWMGLSGGQTFLQRISK